jgi:hypothetical protein
MIAGSSGRRAFATAAGVAARVAIALAVGEACVRILDLDMILLQPLLFYQCGDVEVHEYVDDAERIYGLKPGASHTYWKITQPDPEEPDSPPPPIPRRVTVNRLGFRDAEREAAKPADVTRIVFLGCSNTYGASVGDEDTYTRKLEGLLNAGGGGRRYEVWNAGFAGYHLTQIVAEARLVVAEYQPDVLVFQMDTIGRRPFLGRWQRGEGPRACVASAEDVRPYFERKPDLYRENLRLYPFADHAAGRALLGTSALWRTLVIAANRFLDFEDRQRPDSFATRTSVKAFEDFYRGFSSKVRIFTLLDPFTIWRKWPGVNPEVLHLLAREEAPPDGDRAYMEIHPPAYVYDWYAKRLRDELIRVGVVAR